MVDKEVYVLVIQGSKDRSYLRMDDVSTEVRAVFVVFSIGVMHRCYLDCSSDVFLYMHIEGIEVL